MSWSAFSSCCAAIALGVKLGVITRRGLWSILRMKPPEKEEERNPEETKGFEFGKRESEEEETSVLFSIIFSSSVSVSFGIFF